MMQPADTPQQESDKKRGECRLRNSTKSQKSSEGAPDARVPQEISEVPFAIALSLLRPDEVEKLRRYILSSLDKYPSFSLGYIVEPAQVAEQSLCLGGY